MKNLRGPYTVSILLAIVLLMTVPVIAQDDAEPTDRPFPTRAATATVDPTDRPFPAAPATATDRPFPAAASRTAGPTENADSSAANAEATPELFLADVQATADAAKAQIIQLEAERDSLRAELEASQADNGATTFALVVILVGVLLAVAVFFGLRRSGE